MTSNLFNSSLQRTDGETRTNHRPSYIRLSNQSPDQDKEVLYPDQWGDGASLPERLVHFLFATESPPT